MGKENLSHFLLELLEKNGVPESSWDYYSHTMELSGFFQPDNIFIWKKGIADYTDGVKQHHRYVIKYLLSGKSSCYLDDHNLTLNAGEFFIIFPYQRHNELPPSANENWEILYINFMESAGSEFSILPLKNRVFTPDETEQELIKKLCTGCISKEDTGKTDARMALAWLIARLMSKAENKVFSAPKHTNLADEITEYISRNLDKKLTIPHLCSKFNISATTLRRIFAAQPDNSGKYTSPGAFIRHLKLLRSAEWLLSGKNTLKEIAAFCGYSDQFAFSRAFKKINGISPSKLRKK